MAIGASQQIAQTDPQANYMGPDKGPFKCGHCEYFQAPASCSKVSGIVDAEGCCNLYETIGGGGQAQLSMPRNGPMALSGLRASLRTAPGVPGSPNIQGSL